jgi:hypothetical protein
MKVDRMIPRITISANDGFVVSILVCCFGFVVSIESHL